MARTTNVTPDRVISERLIQDPSRRELWESVEFREIVAALAANNDSRTARTKIARICNALSSYVPEAVRRNVSQRRTAPDFRKVGNWLRLIDSETKGLVSELRPISRRALPDALFNLRRCLKEMRRDALTLQRWDWDFHPASKQSLNALRLDEKHLGRGGIGLRSPKAAIPPFIARAVASELPKDMHRRYAFLSRLLLAAGVQTSKDRVKRALETVDPNR